MSAPALRTAIRLPHATAMVVGIIIGASIFVQPSEVTGQVPTVSGILLVWLVAGVLTCFGALACAELAAAFPRTGGVYVFLRETYSPALGFLWGWAMFWSMHTGIIAAIAMVFARYVGHFVTLGATGTRAVAIVGIALLSAVNYVGVRQGSVLQAAVTAGKLVAIVVIVILAFVLGSGAPSAASAATPAGLIGASASSFLFAVMAGLFAFGGWHLVTYSAGETVDAPRTIPRALMLGTAIVSLCYIALNAAYLYVLPVSAVRASVRVAADAAAVLVGPGGAAAVAGLVIFSTFGALNGVILAGPRVYYAMAGDGLLFRWVAALHPRFDTPHRAIALQAGWASVLVATGSYRSLFTRVVYTEWIFFGLMTAGLFMLRRRAGYAPGYRMWGFPATAVVFVVAAFAIVANQMIRDPLESAFGLLIVILGLPVYLFTVRRTGVAARSAPSYNAPAPEGAAPLDTSEPGD